MHSLSSSTPVSAQKFFQGTIYLFILFRICKKVNARPYSKTLASRRCYGGRGWACPALSLALVRGLHSPALQHYVLGTGRVSLSR